MPRLSAAGLRPLPSCRAEFGTIVQMGKLAVGLAVGFLFGWLVFEVAAPQSRSERSQPRAGDHAVGPKPGTRRPTGAPGARVELQGDRTTPESRTGLAEAPADPISARVRGHPLPSGTHAVIVRKEEDRPFAVFAEAILPTPDQVRMLIRDGYREYVRLQVDERLRALQALLGEDLRDTAREELRRFYEDWAYRKLLAHEGWLAEIKSAELIVDSKKRQLELNRAAMEWALSYARLKIEHGQRLSETFAGPLLKKHDQRLARLAKYSEVAAALRDNDKDNDKK